jgi:hypothetical protein
MFVNTVWSGRAAAQSGSGPLRPSVRAADREERDGGGGVAEARGLHQLVQVDVQHLRATAAQAVRW